MFQHEEHLVQSEFIKHFKNKIDLLRRIFPLFEQYLKESQTSENDYAKYSAVILAGSSLKSLIGALDRISKGYTSDSEALLKKAIEAFFYQTYFYNHSKEAQEWCQKNKKPKLDYYSLAQRLDKLQFDKNFFPTDYENFFTDYVYKVGYRQANRLAHLDFDLVHQEMGLDNDNPAHFAKTLVIAPKFDRELMKTSLLRIVMFSMFQLTMLIYITNQKENDAYKSIFSGILSLFASEDST